MAKKSKPTIEIKTELEKSIPTFRIEQHNKLTCKQKQLVQLLCKDEVQLVFNNGVAGTTKTYCAVLAGLQLLKKGVINQILYVRTAVESADSKLGFMPGDMVDKFNAYTIPLEEKLEEFISRDAIDELKKNNNIQAIPINFLRGVSWKNKFIILDEAQNLTTKELKTFLTRIGENCKVTVLGDHTQSDIGERTGFHKMLKIFETPDCKEKGIHIFKFTTNDVLRSGLCKFITEKFSEFEKHWRGNTD